MIRRKLLATCSSATLLTVATLGLVVISGHYVDAQGVLAGYQDSNGRNIPTGVIVCPPPSGIYAVACPTSGGSGGTVTIGGSLPAGTNAIGTIAFSNGASSHISPSPTPTVTAGSHTVGTSLGGLITLPMTMGILQNFGITSLGGLTPTVDAVLFDTLPVSTTCTDGSLVVIGAADMAKIIPGSPVVVSSWAPAMSTLTQGSGSQLAIPYNPADGAHIYVCDVTQTVVSPATTADLTFGAMVLLR